MSDEFHDRNKIASELTPRQLADFIDDLARLPRKNRTLAEIAQRAEALGLVVSLMSAKSFRDTTFKRHLARIARRQDKAQKITALVGDGSGRALNEAALGIMAEQIFDELNTDADATEDDEEHSRLDLEKIDTLTKAAARIGKGFGEVDRVKALLAESQAKLREYEAREAERAEKTAQAKRQLEAVKKNSGLSAEALAQIEEAAALL